MNYNPYFIWLTGLSGVGEADLVTAFKKNHCRMYFALGFINGDAVRKELNRKIRVLIKDYTENNQKVTESYKIINASVISAFILPKKNRLKAREVNGAKSFIEIFVSTSINGDPKVLFKKALNVEFDNFTGINSLYKLPARVNQSSKTLITPLDKNVNKSVKSFRLNKFVKVFPTIQLKFPK